MTDHHLRSFTWDDLPALVALTNRAAEVNQTDERYTAGTLREELEAHNDPTRDCVVAALPDGSIAGYAYVERRDDADWLWGYGWGTVDPGWRGQGIGTPLVQAADARFQAWIETQAVGDRAVFVQRYIRDNVTDEIALAEAQGYSELRSSYRMQIALDQPLAPAEAPPGFVLRPFDAARDARAVYEVDQAAFMDGGGQPAQTPYDQWREHFIEANTFNPALWWLAWPLLATSSASGDATSPAGVVIGQPWGDDQPQLAWIGRLGVLRRWRGRGLGQALLRQAFYAAQQAGFSEAALGVRADSPVAVQLYTRAGMRIYSRYVHYRKVLRGNPAQIKS